MENDKMFDYLNYEEQLFDGMVQDLVMKQEELDFVETVSDGFYIDCSNMIH